MNRVKEIEKLIDSATLFASFIMQNKKSEASGVLPELAKTLEEVLPIIDGIYDEPEMEEYAQDRAYWSNQVERILGAIEKQDGFMVYDSITNELVMNLNLLSKIVADKGL